MNTPIRDFVTQYAASKPLRYHMPGHKGCGPLGVESLDITEIPRADVLYDAKGIIRESEDNAASLFGSGRTVYSCEGSSLCIRGMLYLATLYGKMQGCDRPLILAGRNCHKAFVTAAALVDFDIEWLYPLEDEALMACRITPSALEARLASGVRPVAVYITTPDYLGNMVDVAGIASVCHRYGVLLLVDNAHGAYLNFLPESRHPMALGADLCCDSAHKTLPVLTGGAYLHIGASAPAWFTENAERGMALFASTSPSYLILQSLDLANLYIASGYRERLGIFVEAVEGMKARLAARGFTLIGDEPLKLCLQTKSYGWQGDELAAWLGAQNVICEFSDPDYVVLMLSCDMDLKPLEAALMNVPRQTPILQAPPILPRPKAVLSVREAVMADSCEMPLVYCVGHILGDYTVHCPPAVPIVVCGEKIDSECVKCLAYYGVKNCRIIGLRPFEYRVTVYDVDQYFFTDDVMNEMNIYLADHNIPAYYDYPHIGGGADEIYRKLIVLAIGTLSDIASNALYDILKHSVKYTVEKIRNNQKKNREYPTIYIVYEDEEYSIKYSTSSEGLDKQIDSIYSILKNKTTRKLSTGN